MTRGRESTHVDTTLGQDLLGPSPANTRYPVEPADEPLKWLHALADLPIKPLNASIQLLDVAQLLSQREPLMLSHEPVQRQHQLITLRSQPPNRLVCKHLRILAAWHQYTAIGRGTQPTLSRTPWRSSARAHAARDMSSRRMQARRDHLLRSLRFVSIFRGDDRCGSSLRRMR